MAIIYSKKDRNEQIQIEIDNYPDICPYCHQFQYCIEVNSIFDIKGYSIMTFHCVNNSCLRAFGYIYEYYSGKYRLSRSLDGKPKGQIFPPKIYGISADFIKIYQQAEQAESMGLEDICGVGYRKSLEFLIKDYIILNNSSISDAVKGKQLGKCIKDHIQNDNIVAMSTRAAWLGNDETHFVRKWESHDLESLKVLINLTVSWINTEELTKDFKNAMPE